MKFYFYVGRAMLTDMEIELKTYKEIKWMIII